MLASGPRSTGLHVVVGRALGTALVTLRGALCWPAADDLDAQLDEVLAQGPERVVLDLTGVTDLDDGGTELLHHARHRVEAQGVRFEITSRDSSPRNS
jgi:anti-anti-sigma regulatory factor